MARLFFLLLTFLWLVGALIFGLTTVHNVTTAVQFGYLEVPPTGVLLFMLWLSWRIEDRQGRPDSSN